MSKLTIGIGEDFPVEEQAGREGCGHRHSRHHHHDHGELHARIHRWMHERFGRHGDTKKDRD
jgi:hypothetical protein